MRANCVQITIASSTAPGRLMLKTQSGVAIFYFAAFAFNDWVHDDK